MADVDRGDRPLSPHLSVYRPEWTMVFSILHRITGAAMTVGATIVAWLMIAAATGEAYYAEVEGWLGSWLGVLVIAGSVFALWYHFWNGVRHLIWDAGYWLELGPAKRSGQLCVVLALAMSALTFAWWL